VLQEVKQETFRTRRRLFREDASKIQTYQDLIIGKRGFLSLLKYELIILFSSWVPGALGLFLRSKLYPLLVGRVGRGVVFGRNVVLRHPHKIFLGKNVIIDDNCLIDAKGLDNNGIVVGDNVLVGRNTILLCTNGDIYIGNNVSIGFNSEIMSANYVKLGENVLVSSYCYLNAATHDFQRTDIPVSEQESTGGRIVLEDNVWLAANVKVLDGVTIGKDSIIGAGAVVNKDLPPLSIAVGIPAKVVRSRKPGYTVLNKTGLRDESRNR
jgi:acetyltransferase-like isoleucine patch superfamily enzyme